MEEAPVSHNAAKARNQAKLKSDAQGKERSLAVGDEELVARAQQGDQGAAEDLYNRYQKKAHAIAYHMCGGDWEEARDLTQEAFLKVFRTLKKFRQDSSFYTWFYRIVVNTCYDVLRAQKRYQTESIEDQPGEQEHAPHFVDKSESPEDYVLRMELGGLIELGIRALPPEQRLVLVLCDVHGYAYEEIVEVTGLPMGTVKSRINRARTKVRDFLLQKPELLPSALRPNHG